VADSVGMCLPQRFPNCDLAPLGGAVGPLGARVVSMRDIYFENRNGNEIKYTAYIFVCTLLG
jgi:hypothetical protein